MTKYTFLHLFLIFIIYTTNAMETSQKASIFSQIVSSLRQRSENHRKVWIKGYLSHGQLRQQPNIPINKQLPPLTSKSCL